MPVLLDLVASPTTERDRIITAIVHTRQFPSSVNSVYEVFLETKSAHTDPIFGPIVDWLELMAEMDTELGFLMPFDGDYKDEVGGFTWKKYYSFRN